MTWDNTGKGQRRLFLFQPTQNGMIALNPQSFNSYIAGLTRTLPNIPEWSIGTVSADTGSDFEVLINAILNPGL